MISKAGRQDVCIVHCCRTSVLDKSILGQTY